MLWTIVFPNSQSNLASDKNSRCKKSSCYARSYYLNKQNKLNLAISLKVVPQYCTGHPVLRIKIM